MKSSHLKTFGDICISCKAGWLIMIFLVLHTSAAWSQDADGVRTMVVLPDKDAVAFNSAQPYPDGKDLRLYTSKSGPSIKPDNVVFMHFGLWSVPAGAEIDEVALSLYLKSPVDTSTVSEQFVRVYELSRQTGEKLNWDNLPILNTDVTGNAIAGAKIFYKPLNKGRHFVFSNVSPQWLANRKGDLWLYLSATSQQYIYHSTRTSDYSVQPKLIIKYHMPPQFAYSNWGQFKYDAQHTAQIQWQSNTTTTGYNIKTVYSAGSGAITQKPVYCNNRLVFNYQSAQEPKNRMAAYSDNGVRLAENTTIGGLVTHGPVADRNSKVYCIVNYNVLKTLDGVDDLKELSANTLNCKVVGGSIPVIGFDGSIYLSTDSGVYAYTPLPELKLKWRYRAPNRRYGTVALSENERTVYTYDCGDDKPGSGRLVAISNINGHERWAVEALPSFATAPQSAPIPSTKGEEVCLTDNLTNGNNFYIIKDDVDSSTVLKKVTGTGFAISQPVIGNSDVFIINSGKLQSYNLNTGAMKEYTELSALEAASSLALDKDQNIYILNTKSDAQSLTMFAAGKPSKPVTVPVPKATYGNLTGNCLLVAPDGKLFAMSNNFLYAFTPSGFNEKAAITIPFNSTTFANEYLYRTENKITVKDNSTLLGVQNAVIHTKKNGVGFGKGFTVKKGAQLRVLTEQ